MPHRMWGLPRPGIEPMSSVLAGRFFTTKPPGKPPCYVLKHLSTCKNGSVDQACIATPLPPGEVGFVECPHSVCCVMSSQSIEEEDTLPFRLQIQAVMHLLHLSPWDLGHVVSPRASACGCLCSCSCWPGRAPQPSSFQLLGFPHPGRRQREDHLEAHLSDIDLSLIHKDFP